MLGVSAKVTQVELLVNLQSVTLVLYTFRPHSITSTTMALVTRVPNVTFKTRVRDTSVAGPNPFRWQDKTSKEIFGGKKVTPPTSTVYQHTAMFLVHADVSLATIFMSFLVAVACSCVGHGGEASLHSQDRCSRAREPHVQPTSLTPLPHCTATCCAR